MVPAIDPSELLTESKQKRKIKPKRFEDCVTVNIVTNSVKNNTKALEVPTSNTEQFRHSFFVRSIIDWNHLEEQTVHAKTVENFKTALQHGQ